MPYSIKKSETTNKTLIVEYGRVKIAELIGRKIKVTSTLTAGQILRLQAFAKRKNLDL